MLPSIPAVAQVVINEVCQRNGNVLMDKDGDYEDWIELYNAGKDTINLKNYSLADRKDRLRKWRFPEVLLPPNAYLIVFASGKNKTTYFDHWDLVIQEPDRWKYQLESPQLAPHWMKRDFDDSAWQVGESGFGYGDEDDRTEIRVKRSLCLRKQFQVINKEAIAQVALHLDYDDAFVAWLNGVEVARANIGLAGKKVEKNEWPYSFVEASIYRNIDPPDHFIIPAHVLENGTNTLAIQVFNSDLISSDLSARPFLSFAQKTPQQVAKAPQPAWYDLEKNYLHTDFKLKAGDTIYLLNQNRKLTDYFILQATALNHSQGRFPDGVKPDPKLFAQATPGKANKTVPAFSNYTDTVFSTLPSGSYASAQPLRLYTKQQATGTNIHYTTDGSLPTTQATLYKDELLVDKTTVIRAQAFREGVLAGEMFEGSYFIGKKHQLPVVSLVTDPRNLWDEETGIYVMGNKADSVHPYYGANFWEEWEMPTQFTYIDTKGIARVNQQVGIKIHGGGSRSQAMKSLRVIARSKYGKNRLAYPFFQQHKRQRYKQLILRNSGQGCNDDHLRDGFLHRLLRNATYLDTQGYEPCVVYINGKYWGIHNMREKINEYTIAAHHQVKRSKVQLLGGAGDIEIAGNSASYDSLRYVLFNQDWQTDPALRKEVLEKIDIHSCLDYFIINNYTANRDWRRDGNVKFWQGPSPKNKWRYFLVDGDISLGFNALPDTNILSSILNDDYYQFKMLQLLLSDPSIEQRFINRTADLLNTVLHPDHIRKELYLLRDYLDTEMPRHKERWETRYDIWKSYFIERSILGFTDKRADFVRLHLEQAFDCGWDVPIQIETNVTDAGTVRVNTIILDQFPWQGYYFNQTPIKLTAIPQSGYVFSHWEIDGEKRPGTSIELMPKRDLACKAVFRQ